MSGFLTQRFSRDRVAYLAVAIVVAQAILVAAPCLAQYEDDAAVGTDPAAPSGSVTMTADQWGHGTQARIRYVAGDGMTMSDPYTSIDILAPFNSYWSDQGNEIVSYFDGRWIIENSGQMAGNFGLGARRYYADSNQIFGANVAYVLDDTHRNQFHQVLISGERIGEVLDFNVTGHVPIGDTQRPFHYSEVSTTPIFSGTNVAFERTRSDELAFTGITAEVGWHLPGSFARNRDMALYAGYYQFDADNAPQFSGFSGRFRTALLPNLYAQFHVTNDDEFKTSFMAYFTWEFTRFFHEMRGPREVRARMTDFTERPSQVVIAERDFSDPVYATVTLDDGTGGDGGDGSGGDGGDGGGGGTTQTLNLIHVSSSASPGGDGSLDSPYQTLAEAEAASATGDIIYVHADSVFDGEMIELKANQKLWGEGPTYTIATNMGTITVPRATSGTNAPIIRNSLAVTGEGAITLANDTEISGFAVENSAGPAIFGDAVSGTITLQSNRMADVFRGIEIRNSPATITITDTTISNTADDGILLADNSGTISITGTTSIDAPGGIGTVPNGGIGLFIQNGSATVTVDDLDITNRSSAAIKISRSEGEVTFTQPLSISNPNASQDEAIGISNSSGDVTFGAVTLDDTARNPANPAGNPTVLMAGNENTVTFDSLDITTSNGGGLRALTISNLTIKDGTIDATGGRAIDINGIAEADITLNSVSATNTDTGILFATSDSGFAGHLTVTGDGENLGSGGTMSNVWYGALTGNVENVVLNFLDVDSSVAGVTGYDTDHLVVNASSFTGSSDGWVGLYVQNTEQDKDGSPIEFTGNTIVSAADNTIGIQIISNKAPAPGNVQIDDSRITLTGAGTIGIDIQAIGDPTSTGPGDLTLATLQDNTVSAPGGTVFQSTVTDGRIFGNLLINGQLFP